MHVKFKYLRIVAIFTWLDARHMAKNGRDYIFGSMHGKYLEIVAILSWIDSRFWLVIDEINIWVECTFKAPFRGSNDIILFPNYVLEDIIRDLIAPLVFCVKFYDVC